MKTEQELEEYWDNKYPKVNMVYGGRWVPKRNEKINLDVRRMVYDNDCMLLDLVRKEKLSQLYCDDTALACQQYVVKNIKYISDPESVGYTEYWQFPFETISPSMMCGDCEDISSVLISLLLVSGVQPWRIRMNAGWVFDDRGIKQGHAYITFCREKNNGKADNNWVILDGCFHEDSQIPVSEKPLAKDNEKYGDIWFSFNNKFSWSYKKYDLFEDLNSEPRLA